MSSMSFSSSGLFLPISLHSPIRCCIKNQALALNPSQFLCSNSSFKFKRQILNSTLQFKKLRNPRTPQAVPAVLSAQSNFFKVVQTVWKVGKDGIEAGTNLVPDFIPRPIARISVTIAALSISLFLLKSVLSTAFTVLAMMGVIYFTFIALNKDKGPKGDGDTTSVEDSLEEARRIMEKYK